MKNTFERYQLSERLFESRHSIVDVDGNPIGGQDNEVEKLMVMLRGVTKE